MNKNEWLAEKCGFTKPGLPGQCWSDPEERWVDLPDFEHSIGELIKWVFLKIPNMVGFDAEIISRGNNITMWDATIQFENTEAQSGDCYYSLSSRMITLTGALFNVCCEALGWEEPGEQTESESVPEHDDSIIEHILSSCAERAVEEVTLLKGSKISLGRIYDLDSPGEWTDPIDPDDSMSLYSLAALQKAQLEEAHTSQES